MLSFRRACLAVVALAPVVTLLGSSPTTTATAAPEADRQAAVQLRKASPIVISAPSTAKTGSSIRLVGDVVVAAKKPRAVQLAEKRGSRWKVIARVASGRTGKFVFRVPAGKTLGTRVFRAQAPRAGGLAAVRTGAVKVKITKGSTGTTGPTIPGGADYDAAEALPNGYVAAGAKSDWSYLDFSNAGGVQAARWNPCDVIRWRYNDNGESYGALADVTRAIAKIAGVSGLKFRYAGTTSFSYRGQDDPDFPANADLFVSWASAAQFSELNGSTVGVGGGSATTAGASDLGADFAFRMSVGYLTLDKAPSSLVHGFDAGPGWGQIMMHETLHAMGLGHAQQNNDSRQVMAPTASSLNYQFGAGDITGMHKVGLHPGDTCE